MVGENVRIQKKTKISIENCMKKEKFEYFWILILFPLIGALLNGIFGNRFSTKISAWLSCSASGLSFLGALNTFWEFLHLPVNERIIKQHLFTWIQSGNFVAEFSFLLDPLSMVMILIVTGIGFLFTSTPSST